MLYQVSQKYTKFKYKVQEKCDLYHTFEEADKAYFNNYLNRNLKKRSIVNLLIKSQKHENFTVTE